MSDEHHDHDGGHELEAIDPGQLFRLVGGLSLVVFISIIAVIQWFHKQQAELRETRSDYTFLADHEAREAELLEGIAKVSEKTAGDPASMKPVSAPPPGWIHPDDIKTGGAPAGDAAMPADGAKDPAGAPAEGADEDGADEEGADEEGAEDGADASEDAEVDGEGADEEPAGGADDADADAGTEDGAAAPKKGNNGKGDEKKADAAKDDAADKPGKSDKTDDAG